MNTTIKHSAIKNRPLIAIEKENTKGPNEGKKYGISFTDNSRSKSSIEHYGVTHNVEFPLEIIIQDYIRYYGLSEAIKILIGKKIINSINRPIIIK